MLESCLSGAEKILKNAKLRVSGVAFSITNDSMSDRAKVQVVHDWIVNSTVYDCKNYLNNMIVSRQQYGSVNPACLLRCQLLWFFSVH